jgi:hypothetical protein
VTPRIYVSKGPTKDEYIVHCPELGIERHPIVTTSQNPHEVATTYVIDRLERAVKHLKESLP